jgi:hypothetical protein
MKNLFQVCALVCVMALGACSAHIVDNRPADVVYTRPAAPGPDYVWIDGDWVWSGGTYVWHEGRWDRPRAGRHWNAGHWESHGNGWKWRAGEWK